MTKPYQPKTGAKCGCRRGVERDNCPVCEGTGWVIDFAAIRARRTNASGFVVSRCDGGFVVRPVESLDNRRWYFDNRQQAHEWIEYLERIELTMPL